MTEGIYGVVGAGIMGCGIATDLACRGKTVIVHDIAESALAAGPAAVRENANLLRFSDGAFRAVRDEDVLGRIRFTREISDLAPATFVVENVTENFQVKSNVYRDLGKICSTETVFAVNTSCVSITRVGSLVPNPARVVGMHFMNPVPMKKLIEVIRGYHTSDATIGRAKELASVIAKEAVVVNDYPGFVTNRVMMLMINECAYVVQDGVASPADVDKIFRLGFAHKMGPLATADLIGLDTILQSVEVLYESYNDSKYRPCPLLKKMVDA
ncbi:MAG TPA: 3-hydroxyacyl-CoA dehydrogenase NAD-binding domain-containing protein, partial [Myxococcota bacterium]|nr:3-hydroxyacyl-CoA dehydrogenase NAD-binding domain-containing protein [Myxococcota bacterium]